MESFTEENYLKIIYHLSCINPGMVQTNAITERIQTKRSPVCDMVKKPAKKGW